MKRKHLVLTNEQRHKLEQFTKVGSHKVRIVNRAKVILALDSSEGRVPAKQVEISSSVGVSRNTVNAVRRDFMAAASVDEFLQRKKRATPPRKVKITGEVEAHIIALACSEAPPGYARWTVQLLADKCVELNYIDSISSVGVHRVLKKHLLSLT